MLWWAAGSGLVIGLALLVVGNFVVQKARMAERDGRSPTVPGPPTPRADWCRAGDSGGKFAVTVWRVKRAIAVFGASALLASGFAVYVYVGQERASNARTADPPGEKPWKTASYSWSWNPVGFECLRDGQRQWTSLWPDN
jgi:hypothetical protein